MSEEPFKEAALSEVVYEDEDHLTNINMSKQILSLIHHDGDFTLVETI